MNPHPDRMSKKLMTTSAVAAAAAVLAVGAYLLGTTQSDSSASGAPTANFPAQGRGHFGNGGAPPAGRGAGPGFGNAVTGATADKVAKAATADHPGTVERVVQLPDGSYLAHVLTDNGEIYVAVSKNFEVTGTQERPERPQFPSAPQSSQPSTPGSTS